MLWISISNADSLVADDYYKEGRAINQRLEKDQQAVRLGVQLLASFDVDKAARHAEQRQILVQFKANPTTRVPDSIRIRLSHPTLDRRDITATLIRSKNGHYQTEIPKISAGRWHVHLEDDQSSWRVKTTWTLE